MDAVLKGYLRSFIKRCKKPHTSESRTGQAFATWCLNCSEGKEFFPWWLTPLLADPENGRLAVVDEDGHPTDDIAPNILIEALMTVTKGAHEADQYMPKGVNDDPLYQYSVHKSFCNETQAAFGLSCVAYATMVKGKRYPSSSAASTAAESVAISIYGPMPSVAEDAQARVADFQIKNVIAAVPKRIELLQIWGIDSPSS
jgi:hypothetical protein